MALRWVCAARVDIYMHVRRVCIFLFYLEACIKSVLRINICDVLIKVVPPPPHTYTHSRAAHKVKMPMLITAEICTAA
jgi:hypothetical protein